MKMYEVKHRCGCKLTVIDESYQGGNYPYCKKCKTNVSRTPLNVKNQEFKFVELRVPEPVSSYKMTYSHFLYEPTGSFNFTKGWQKVDFEIIMQRKGIYSY